MKPSNILNTTLSTIMNIPAERLAILEKIFMITVGQTHSLCRQTADGYVLDGFYIYCVRHLLDTPLSPHISLPDSLPDVLHFFKDKAFLNVCDALGAIIAAIGIRADIGVRNTLVDCIVNGKTRAIYNALDYPLTIERHYVFFTDFDTEIIPRIHRQQVAALAKVPTELRGYVNSIKPAYTSLLNMAHTRQNVFNFNPQCLLDNEIAMAVYETHFVGTIDSHEFDTSNGGHLFATLPVAMEYINSKPGLDHKRPDTGNWLNCKNGQDWWVTKIHVCTNSFDIICEHELGKLRTKLSELTDVDCRMLGLVK